jgi:hypothetical protein
MFAAWIGDHPRLSLLAGVVLGTGFLFYGIRLNGFAHMAESLSRWRMEVFGGTFRVERSVEVPDVILSFHHEAFDRVDTVSASAGFMGGTAFRKEIAVIAGRPGARIRIVAHDPRMSVAGHPRHEAFVAEGAAYGMKPWEYSARCRHSAAVLLHLLEDFAPVMEARLLDTPLASASPPFFTSGRSVQLYRADNPATRLDILVFRPSESDGMDSFAHSGLIIRHRPDAPEVRKSAGAFNEAWRLAKPVDAAVRAEILNLLSLPQ